MNIEDLKVGDTVESKCLRCGELHLWGVNTVHLAPRVALKSLSGKQSCGVNAQLVYAAGIERKVTV